MDEVYNVVPYKTFDETVGYKIELSMGIRKFSSSSILYYRVTQKNVYHKNLNPNRSLTPIKTKIEHSQAR